MERNLVTGKKPKEKLTTQKETWTVSNLTVEIFYKGEQSSLSNIKMKLE